MFLHNYAQQLIGIVTLVLVISSWIIIPNSLINLITLIIFVGLDCFVSYYVEEKN